MLILLTKNVLITISGLHYDESALLPEEDNEPIEVMAPALYYLKNGKHYIFYEEPVHSANFSPFTSSEYRTYTSICLSCTSTSNCVETSASHIRIITFGPTLAFTTGTLERLRYLGVLSTTIWGRPLILSFSKTIRVFARPDLMISSASPSFILIVFLIVPGTPAGREPDL